MERVSVRSDTEADETQSFGDGAFGSGSYKRHARVDSDSDDESSLEYIPIRINPNRRV